MNCFFCNSSLSSRSTLKRHYTEQHGDRLPINCFYSESRPNESYECFECDIVFSRQEHLDNHFNSKQHKDLIKSKKNTTPLINFLKKKITNFNNNNEDADDDKENNKKNIKRESSDISYESFQKPVVKKLKLDLTDSINELNIQLDSQQLEQIQLQEQKDTLLLEFENFKTKLRDIDAQIKKNEARQQSMLKSIKTINEVIYKFSP
jgi:chromosome segregation ATPase